MKTIERFRGALHTLRLQRDLGAAAPRSPVQAEIDIPTALTEPERRCLADLARGRVVLEVGAQLGASTVVMAREARLVHSVDWHRGDPVAGEGETLLGYWRNLHVYGVRDRVVAHVGDVSAVLPSLRPAYFDGVFVDGCHEEDAVRRDIALVEPLVAADGWFAFHDYGRFAVAPSVDEFAERLRADLDLVDSIAVAYRPTSA
jgi:predicted O-methyltransferase YrrM